MPVYKIGSKNILFIHVPKTAGMSISSHLGSFGPSIFEERLQIRGSTFSLRHQPAPVLTSIYFPDMIDYAFMIVRHPVARIVSEYRYQRRRGRIQLSRLRMFGFDIWLNHALRRSQSDPTWRAGHFRPQTDFECFGAEVFRYEEGLDRAIRRISDLTGVKLPVTPPRTNVSIQRSVRISQSSLDLIADRYAADFERFGYRIEVPTMLGVTGP